MADNAVKITALPAVSSLQSTDLIPAVDSSGTQTVKATLQQVQDLGPGAGTVTEPTLAPGAVTSGKTGFSAPGKFSYASQAAQQNSTSKYIGIEGDISDYSAQTLLPKNNAADWFDAIGMSPNFNGPITVPYGTRDSSGNMRPTYTFGQYANDQGVRRFSGDLTTGMFGGTDDSGLVNFASAGQHIMSISPDRIIRFMQQPVGTAAVTSESTVEQQARLLEFIGFNAYATLNLASSPTPRVITAGPNTENSVGYFLGLPYRTASTLTGSVGHGPAIETLGTAGVWAGGNITSSTPAAQLALDQNGQNGGAVGEGTFLMAQRKALYLGYNPNVAQGFSLNTPNTYSSWWDNAVLRLTAVDASTGVVSFSSIASSYNANKTVWRGLSATPLPTVTAPLVGKMRGFSSVTQSGSGASILIECTFDQPYPDTEYTVFIGGTATNGVVGNSITKTASKVTFKISAVAGTGTQAGTGQVFVGTMR